MDLKTQNLPFIASDDLHRIVLQLGILHQAYQIVAERHLDDGNEADLEEFAQVLGAFHHAIDSQVTVNDIPPNGDLGVPDEVVCFYERCFNLMFRL